MSRRAWQVALLALVALAHLWAFPYQPILDNPNENVRFFMTAAIVEEHTYAIETIRARWGWVNDAAVKDGHVYSVKAPGASELGVPAYAAYKWLCDRRGVPLDREVALWCCRAFASIFPAILFAIFYRRFLIARAGRHGVLADLTLVSICLGSLLFAYGMMFVSHTQSAAAAFTSFVLLTEASKGAGSGSGSPSGARKFRVAKAFLAGVLASGVTYFEYPGVVVTAVLCVYALFALRWTRWLPFAIGAAIPTLLVMHFQWKCFGSPFTPGHLYMENPAFRAVHHTGFFGADKLHLEALQLLGHPGYGLFPLTPILIFAPAGFFVLAGTRGKRVELVVSAAIVMLSTAVVLFLSNWRGGWTMGPRYLAVIVPFVGWWAMEGLVWLARQGRADDARAFALATTLAGLVLSGIPSLWYPCLAEDIDRPFGQLFTVLIAHDFAPLTVLSWLDVFGVRAMTPLLLAPLAITARTLVAAKQRTYTLVVALSVAVLVVLIPGDEGESVSSAVARAVEFVCAHWDPPGHDRVALLRDRIAATPHPDAREVQALIDALREEHREAEARMAEGLMPR